MRTAKAKKYTPQEDEYILKTIKKSGSNRATHLKIAGKLNRTCSAIGQRVTILKNIHNIPIDRVSGYTQQEDAIIVDYIRKKRFRNLREAFRNLSGLINRTKISIEQRYYSYLKHNYDMFYLSSGTEVVANTKFVHEGKEPDLRPFQVIVKQIMDLPREEKNKVLAFFK